MDAIGIATIFERNLTLLDRLIEGISSLDVRVISPLSPETRSSIVSCKFSHTSSKTVVQRLGAKQIIVSPRGDYFRISPHLYTTAHDVDLLVEELTAIDKSLI